ARRTRVAGAGRPHRTVTSRSLAQSRILIDMSGAVCPKCGVPVTPGYVRCPKCRAPQPRRATTIAPGGTAVDSMPFPVVPVAIVGGVVVAMVVAYFALRGGGGAQAARPAPGPAPSASPTAGPG